MKVTLIKEEENYKFKPTMKTPTEMGKKYDTQYKNATSSKMSQISEDIDAQLNEEEKTKKKRLFKLSKMESLVHNDDRLSRIYKKMVEDDAQERFGYHYNETIMNIMFNDYVLNNDAYLQKYKNAVPKKKKRRDKSGINQLMKTGTAYDGEIEKDDTKDKEVNEIFGKLFGGKEDYSNFIRKPEQTKPNDILVFDDSSKKLINIIPREELQKYSSIYMNKLMTSLSPRTELDIKSYKDLGYKIPSNLKLNADPQDGDVSLEETTGAASSGAFSAPMGYENKVDETTTSSSSGSYSTPFAWGKNGKGRYFSKPIWSGGVVLQEGIDYITNPRVFVEFAKLNETIDMYNEQIGSLDKYKEPASRESFIDTLNKIKDNAIGQAATYTDPKYKAYFDELIADIDAEIKATQSDIDNNVKFRANEDHLSNKNDKIDFILKNTYDDSSDSSKYDINKLNTMDDNEIDSIYKSVENKIGISENDYVDALKTDLKNNGHVVGDNESVDKLEAKEGLFKDKWRENSVDEKSTSQAQQKFMGMVLATKRGEMKNPSKEVADAAKSMSLKDVEDFASTKHEDLPSKINEMTFVQIPEIINFFKTNGITPESIDKFITDNGMTPNDFKDLVKFYIANGKMIRTNPEQNDILNGLRDSLNEDIFDDKLASYKVENDINELVGKKVIEDFLKNPENSYTKNIFVKLKDKIKSLISKVSNNPTNSTIRFWLDANGFNELKKYANVIWSNWDLENLNVNENKNMKKDNFDIKKITNILKENRDKNKVARISSLNESDRVKFIKESSMIDQNDQTMAMNSNPQNSMANTIEKPVGETPFPEMSEDEKVFDRDKEQFTKKTIYSLSNLTDDQKYNSMVSGIDVNDILTSLSSLDKSITTYSDVLAALKNIMGNDAKLAPTDILKIIAKVDPNMEKYDVKNIASIVASKIKDIPKNIINNPDTDIETKRGAEKADYVERFNDLLKNEFGGKSASELSVAEKNKLMSMIGVNIEKEPQEVMNEERKTNSMLNLDKVKAETKKNTEADMKNSDALDFKKMYGFDGKDGDIHKGKVYPNPDAFYINQDFDDVQKGMVTFADLEKMALSAKNGSGNSLENVGDSTREDNNIPKRNLTDDEQTELMLNRGKGMEDIVYDNKPSEKFEKRMEKDMGEKVYDNRQKKIEFASHAPMYNKDTQPVKNSTDKDEHDNKYAKGYNSEMNESYIDGIYLDAFKKRKFVKINVSESISTDNIKGLTKIQTDAIGNLYTSKVSVNENAKTILNKYEFYINESDNKIYFVEKNNKKAIVESIDKIKKLSGYNPSKYIS